MGTYSLVGWVYGGTEENPVVSMVVDPTLAIDRPVTVAVDARVAKRALVRCVPSRMSVSRGRFTGIDDREARYPIRAAIGI